MARGSEQWQAIQDKYGILEQIDSDGFARITSAQINETQADYPELKFEARLLTHFDNAQQLPDLFKQNKLSILPVERGSYVVGQFNIFMPINESPDNLPVCTLPAKVDLYSLQESNLVNESMGLNFAFAHGITADFAGESLTATIAGRQKGGSWSYRIESNGQQLELKAMNPQIEIDGGYEGETSIVLIEAKNTLVQEFCLRQLYFPFRCWQNKSKAVGKTVRTFFAAINDGEVILYEYIFPDAEVFRARLLRATRYQIANNVITVNDLKRLIESTPVEEEPLDLPFPQADSLLRTIDLVEYVAKQDDGAKATKLAEHYGFHPRQGLYYGDAASYLGFVSKSTVSGTRTNLYKANSNGRSYAALATQKEKNLCVIKALLIRPKFREVIITTLENGRVPSKEEIAPLLLGYRSDIGDNTVGRRASTVRNWVTWVTKVIDA